MINLDNDYKTKNKLKNNSNNIIKEENNEHDTKEKKSDINIKLDDLIFTKLTKISFNSDEIWINLKLISKVKPNEKLKFDLSNNLFSIDTSLIQCITRYYYGYDRNMIVELIDILIMNTFNKMSGIIDNRNNDINYYTTLIKYINELNNVIDGLINLKITYSGDQLIQSKIDYIIEKIRNNVSNDNLVLKN